MRSGLCISCQPMRLGRLGTLDPTHCNGKGNQRGIPGLIGSGFECTCPCTNLALPKKEVPVRLGVNYLLSDEDASIVEATTRYVLPEERQRIATMHEEGIHKAEARREELVRELEAVERAIAMRRAAMAVLRSPEQAAAGEDEEAGPTVHEAVLVGGEVLANVHDPELCAGKPCCIHNPSDHHMREWRQHWRGDRGIMERLCPDRGIGHPDPDTLFPPGDDGTHGCDGCCRPWPRSPGSPSWMDQPSSVGREPPHPPVDLPALASAPPPPPGSGDAP